jgi:sugar phosphate isomerase/epimerase
MVFRSAQDPWRGLKIGVATYSLRKLSTETAIKAIRRVGLSYASIKDVHLPRKTTLAERQAIIAQFTQAGITPLSCGNINLPNNEGAIRDTFQYAKEAGIPVIVCAPDPIALPTIEAMVKEFDIKIAIHNHGPEDKHFPTPYEALRRIDKMDSRMGLCIDVGHCLRGGADPVKAIRDGKERLYDVHLKDIAQPRGGNKAMEVGRGVLDIRGILQALIAIGFTGSVGFEYEKDADDPLPGIAESTGYVRGVLNGLPPT